MSDPRAPLKRQILALLRNNADKAFRGKEIATRLNIRENDRYQAFSETLEALDEAGLVSKAKGGRYQHRPRTELHTGEGTLRMDPQGHGFVAVPAHGDYYIPATRLSTALHGDWVRIALAADVKDRPDSRHQEAEIVEVLERKRVQTVGTFEKMGAFAFVKSDDRRMHKDVYVPEDAFNGAKQGDKVLVSIDAFTDPKAAPEGRILDVLGDASDPRVANLAIALNQGIEYRFPKEVDLESQAIPEEIPEEEIARRLDLRSKNTFTIDPTDAKDFDDAIHIEQLDNGNVALGVHIADVSHYVKQGTALDGEAYRRGTSTYLVGRVIPMLPERLSNGVCSLRPNEDKLAFSVLMEVTPRGGVKSYEIRETVIRSHHRLSYEEAQEIIDGGDHPAKDDVLLAAKLARALNKKRRKQGAIDFGSTEAKFELDDEGRPLDIIPKPRLEANRLIEELMLLANVTAAEHIGGKKKAAPFVYRIHDRPDAERIKALREYVTAFGYSLPAIESGSVERRDLAALLDHVNGTPHELVVTEAALRSMAKAIYSPVNIGHYGLGFKHYTHYTSPIRRYPDLIAHRLLKHYTAGGGRVSEEALAEACEHCSAMERQAVEAERESVRLKQAEYVAQHVGDEFDGVVKGVTKFGVFVEMTKLLTEGLVHVRDMDDDFYEFDQRSFTLTGVRKKRVIRLGDTVRVRVVSASVESRKIDLVFADQEEKPSRNGRKSSHEGSRKRRRPAKS
jgi:ribonuclease R